MAVIIIKKYIICSHYKLNLVITYKQYNVFIKFLLIMKKKNRNSTVIVCWNRTRDNGFSKKCALRKQRKLIDISIAWPINNITVNSLCLSSLLLLRCK